MYSIRASTEAPRPAHQVPAAGIHLPVSVHALPGRGDVGTTMIGTHVPKIAAGTVASPLDAFAQAGTGRLP